LNANKQTNNKRLHAEGFGAADVTRALEAIPLASVLAAALRTLHMQPANELCILSDANDKFIEIILAHHNLRPLFAHIVTNPVLRGCAADCGSLNVEVYSRPRGLTPDASKSARSAPSRTIVCVAFRLPTSARAAS
jgi:hypothetical protein